MHLVLSRKVLSLIAVLTFFSITAISLAVNGGIPGLSDQSRVIVPSEISPSLPGSATPAGNSPGMQPQDSRAAYLEGYATGYRDGMIAAYKEMIDMANERTDEISKVQATGGEYQPASLTKDIYNDIKLIVACYAGCAGRQDYWECVDNCLEPIWSGTSGQNQNLV